MKYIVLFVLVIFVFSSCRHEPYLLNAVSFTEIEYGDISILDVGYDMDNIVTNGDKTLIPLILEEGERIKNQVIVNNTVSYFMSWRPKLEMVGWSKTEKPIGDGKIRIFIVILHKEVKPPKNSVPGKIRRSPKKPDKKTLKKLKRMLFPRLKKYPYAQHRDICF